MIVAAAQHLRSPAEGQTIMIYKLRRAEKTALMKIGNSAYPDPIKAAAAIGGLIFPTVYARRLTPVRRGAILGFSASPID